MLKPALLTNTCTVPKAATVSATSRRQSAAVPRSASMKRQPIVSATARLAGTVRSTTTPDGRPSGRGARPRRGGRRRRSAASSEPNLLHQSRIAYVADLDPTLGEQLLHIVLAACEAMVQPHGVTVDCAGTR